MIIKNIYSIIVNINRVRISPEKLFVCERNSHNVKILIEKNIHF